MNRSLQTLRMVAGVVLLAAAVTRIAVGGGDEPGDEAPNLSGSRPNIILFLADDLSYWDISHFGQEEFSTPHLDRMAREGMVFTNAYAASPQCASSRGGPPGASPAVDNQYARRSPLTYLKNAKDLALHINAGIRDGHQGSVPISHSLLAFNEVAEPDNRLSTEDIQYFVENAAVPGGLHSDFADPSYGTHKPLFRRVSGKATVTIFDGGHELVAPAAMAWIQQIRNEKQHNRPAGAVHTRTPSSEALVFLIAGQSNAGGVAAFSPETNEKAGMQAKHPTIPGSTAEEVGIPTVRDAYPRSFIWKPGSGPFERLTPGTNLQTCYRDPWRHGIELPLAMLLEKQYPDADKFFVKHGPGGHNLHTEWQAGSGPDYKTFMGQFDGAMAELKNRYEEVRVLGLYWDQGESDRPKAQQYGQNLRALFAAFRKDTGIPDLPIFVRKHLFQHGDESFAPIRHAQVDVTREDPHAHLLDLDLGSNEKNFKAWAWTDNNGHLSSKAYLELSQRIVAADQRQAWKKALADNDYAAIARAYADYMIEYGRDRYGKLHSPVFVSVMDRTSGTVPKGAPYPHVITKPYAPGLRRDHKMRPYDRTCSGANPLQDRPLYGLLYRLSELTGEQRYAEEADKSIAWFLDNAQSPATGLYAWGSHMFWDVHKDQAVYASSGRPDGGYGGHEYNFVWPYWDRHPEALQRFAHGLWDHQITDQKTGRFSRHAAYHKHGPGDEAFEFPQTGSCYLEIWARQYGRGGDPEMKRAIRTLLARYRSLRDPQTGAMSWCSVDPPGRREQANIGMNLFMATALQDAAGHVEKRDPQLADQMREFVRFMDDEYMSNDYDQLLDVAGKGVLMWRMVADPHCNPIGLIPPPEGDRILAELAERGGPPFL